MVTIRFRQRVEKLEGRLGANAFERWLKSCSDEELGAAIAETDREIGERLAQYGVDITGMSIMQMCECAEQHGLVRHE